MNEIFTIPVSVLYSTYILRDLFATVVWNLHYTLFGIIRQLMETKQCRDENL